MRMRFIDLHNDAVTCLNSARLAKHIAKAEKAGVETIIMSVWTTEMQDPLRQIKHYRKILDDIGTNIKLLLHIEDAWFVNEQNISEFIELKPYSVGLTWNTNNNLAEVRMGIVGLHRLAKLLLANV